MDITDPSDVTNAAGNVVQETPDQSNVQKRINELTAEKYAAQKMAEQQADQVAQLTKTVAAMMERQNAAVQQLPQQEQVPEGLDPAIAKFLSDKLSAAQKESEARTQQLYWQMQHQMDQQQVTQKYSNLPTAVLQDAAKRLTALKQRYGDVASMDDAIALAHFEHFKKQGQVSAAQQFNQMGQPLSMQSGPASQQSTNMASPASLPNWNALDLVTQNRLIDEWEKKGGSLISG